MSNTSYLWVHVKEARVSEPDPNVRADVQVSVQVGSSSPFTSGKSLSPNPKWEEDIMLTLSDEDMMDSLSVELFKPKFFFRKELLGRTSLPLFSIRHSNKPSDGFWVNLFLPSTADAKDSNIPTPHQIRLDAHFELPKDIPPDVVELLEKKLETFNSVLEEEAEILENQEHKIITGVLSPPPSVVHERAVEELGPQVVEEDIVQQVLVHDLSAANPYSDVRGTETSPPSHMEEHFEQEFETGPETPPYPAEDFTDGSETPSLQPDDDVALEFADFADFDWMRNSPPAETTPQKRGSHPIIIQMSPRVSELRKQQQPKSASLDRKQVSGRDIRTGSLPTVVVTERAHNEGASASGAANYPAVLRSSHGAGVGSEVSGSVESIPYAMVSANRARANWARAMEKLLPEVRQQLAKKTSTFAGLLTLSELVNQLQSVKTKSQLMVEQDIIAFSSANSQFKNRSRSVLDVKKKIMHRKHHVDERVKMDVYRRALEALLYPASEPDSHTFEAWSARKPTTCSECNYLLWGLKKQGVKCTRCGKICHERCATLSSQDCFIHDQHSAISDKMHRMLVNHANRFEILQLAFNISTEKQKHIQGDVESRILKMADTFNAEVNISVVGAQGLLIPKNLSQRVYVSVAVGDESKKTEVFKRKDEDKGPPTWTEDFMFNCNNYHDAIQLRVWNERDSAMAKMATKFTKEGDLFLGQKIIEVRRVGTSQEVWYKLDKRTEKGPDVSGHIKVNISVKVEGESLTPFHQQYIKLHELLFFHCHVHKEKDLIIVPPKVNPGEQNVLQLLPTVAQEVADEFALRYAVEPIFRMMIHIELLVNHHSIHKALLVINNMLKNLKYLMFIHVAADHAARAIGATALMEEFMDASNFGRDKFSKLLDKLQNSLRLDLQQYREFYPHKDEQKLAELVETFELMATVVEFQQQAMGVLTTGKASELIVESMKECLKNTFDFIVQSNMRENYSGHPALDPERPPFEFFYQTMKQIRSVILEDRTVYGKFLPKFCKVNFGDISAVELWHLFSATIEGLFDNDTNLEAFKPSEYITLLFTIKSFYDAELKMIASREGKVPEYPRWFVRPVQRWLHQQYQKEGMFFLDNAWDDDKNRLKFEAHENQKLSSSTFQMFFYLHQGLDFILNLESGDVEMKEQHYEDFSLVIVNIVQYYVDKISVTIPEYTSDLKIMCMLLNNLQAFRANIHSLFEEMGGSENAGAGASRILSEFQQVLSKQLTSWCGFVARSLQLSVLQAVRTVQESLTRLKGSQGSIERVEVKEIVKPLFDLLADRLGMIAITSEQFVLQKVIKEVWYICMECMHHMLLPTLKWEHDGVDATAGVNFPVHHYSGRQCTALEIMMELLKDFFQAAESQGIKMSTIERGIKQLRGVIALYRETTERLITDFVMDETRPGVQDQDTSCGEVYMAVDAFCHPGSGELDGSIRVISASGLKGFPGIGNLKPMIELNFISPTISSFKKNFITHPAKSSYNPNFNETFKFTLTNWETSELLVVAKHHVTFGKDKVIGLALTSCTALNDQANLTLTLRSCSVVTDMGQAILNVLSARTFDEFAKEFVILKTNQRCAVGDEVDELEPSPSSRPRKLSGQGGGKGGLLSGFRK